MRALSLSKGHRLALRQASAHVRRARDRPRPQLKPEPEPKTLEELLAELDALIGLTEVKAEIHRQVAVLRVETLRSKAGLKSPTITRHLVFGQSRHRQDNRGSAGRRHLPGARAAVERPAGRS